MLINYFHCKPLRCSLQLAKTKKRTNRGRNIVAKDKTPRKAPHPLAGPGVYRPI
ncbi:hypothetical protein [Cyclobacterium salsum]|uniref:hypothetical protein n=1 Tax=Cyclobacterium salsum TaxID=2666329 RepID=UPI001390D1CF|nr:hypothetical protein [Cyclobacterium salsum]